LHKPISGITKSSLWTAWKGIRADLRRSSIRDVVDFLEYDIDPTIWINRLLERINDGSYEPTSPRRFMLAKTGGFSRQMTIPTIRDLVLYRAIADYLYEKAKRFEKKHVYFLQANLSKAADAAAKEAREEMFVVSRYGSASRRSFLQWLRYDQYRRYLILKEIFPYLVITDITNFFDSILYSHVAEALRRFATPSRMIGLLFFILERLSIRADYADSARIGLPVDEFDCSRVLAHIVLFSHDYRMVDQYGEDAYVRWMDDQNIGVNSRAEGLGCLDYVQRSLLNAHLTPNSKKSRVLSLAQARRHFHLDINELLDRAEKLPARTKREKRALGNTINKVWSKAKMHEGHGEWDKILKRIYRLAGKASARRFRNRALRDILASPDSTQRISDYIRCTGSGREHLVFVEKVINHREQLYASVNLALIEGLLRLEVTGEDAKRIRQFSTKLLNGDAQVKGMKGYEECASIAPLLLLRFGDRRSLPTFESCLHRKFDRILVNPFERI